MAQTPQTYQNHARMYPLYHYIVAPIFMINFFVAIWRVYKQPTIGMAWDLVVAFGLVALVLVARLMALKVQDRVIRLEMRLRMQQVLPADLCARAAGIAPSHLVALRFASDAELAELVRDVLDGKLSSQKAIKERVKTWEPDYLRA